MKSNYRKGSLGEADAKTANKMLIAFAIIVTLTCIAFLVPFPVDSAIGYFHAYFVRTETWVKALSFIAMSGWFLLWKLMRPVILEDVKPTVWIWMALLAGYVLLIFLFAGFNFDLHGIEK